MKRLKSICCVGILMLIFSLLQINAYANESSVKEYSKKKDGETNISANFKVKEFACNDGSDKILIDTDLVKILQNIREYFNKPVHINSAYRTIAYNKVIGGASKSNHTKGMAADIYVSGVSPAEVAKYAETIGVKGIGKYGSFVHVDTRDTKYYWIGHAEEKATTFGGNYNSQPYNSVSGKSDNDYIKEDKNPCSHTSYNDYGRCKKCDKEYYINENPMSATTYQAVKNDVPVRNRPYSPEKITKYLSKGAKVTVVASGKNSVGNLWYKLNDGSWVYSKNLEKYVEKAAGSTLNINFTQYPESIKQGNSFSLRGDVSSNYKITSVKGYIINSSGTNIYTTSDYPDSKSMDIRSAKLNQNLPFGKLSSGNYTLKVVATDSSGSSKTWKKDFSVSGNSSQSLRISNPNQNIQKGQSGTSVKELQQCLNKLMGAGLTADGIFGNKTLEAVKAFQSKYGLSADGIAGPKTNSKINSLLQ